MMTFLLFIALFFCIALGQKLKVGTKEFIPFVQWKSIDPQTNVPQNASGFTVDLWEMVVKELGDVEYEFQVPVDGSLSSLLNGVDTGAYDLAISAVSITKEREIKFDFTQGYYMSGIGIAVPYVSGSILSMLTSATLWTTLPMSQAVRESGSSVHIYLEGLWEAFWFSVVTVTTVGYGDKVPITKLGRWMAVLWLLIGLAVFGTVVGVISSEIAAVQSAVQILQASQLSGKVVCTDAGSTSDAWIKQFGVASGNYPEKTATESVVDMCLKQVDDSGLADAVVLDYPVLDYALAAGGNDNVALLPQIYARQAYGAVFKKSAASDDMIERINQALLGLEEGGQMAQLREKYFGAQGSSLEATGGDPSKPTWSTPSTQLSVSIAGCFIVIHVGLLIWLSHRESLMLHKRLKSAATEGLGAVKNVGGAVKNVGGAVINSAKRTASGRTKDDMVAKQQQASAIIGATQQHDQDQPAAAPLSTEHLSSDQQALISRIQNDLAALVSNYHSDSAPTTKKRRANKRKGKN